MFCRYVAVNKLGGDQARWLACWETWVALHVTAAWQLPHLQAVLTDGGWSPLRQVVYHGCLSVAFPLVMATIPFRGCSQMLLNPKSLVDWIVR